MCTKWTKRWRNSLKWVVPVSYSVHLSKSSLFCIIILIVFLNNLFSSKLLNWLLQILELEVQCDMRVDVTLKWGFRRYWYSIGKRYMKRSVSPLNQNHSRFESFFYLDGYCIISLLFYNSILTKLNMALKKKAKLYR